MKKIDLINELSVEFHKVGKVAPVDLSPTDKTLRDVEGVTWYIAGVYEKKDKRLIRRNISFYVDDEGKPTETAFYAEKLPGSILSEVLTDFRDIVLEEISTRTANGEIEKANIDAINETARFAIVTAYLLKSDIINAQRYFVYEDINFILKFKEMGK
jgi:hypothetical protein